MALSYDVTMRGCMRIKTGFFACLVLLAVGFSASAADKNEASAFTDTLGHHALTIIADKALSKEDKRSRLEALFEKNVDINWIGKFVLGRNWRDATDEQKRQYITNYKTFIIRHYTSNLSEFTNADFKVTKVTPEERGGNIVTMHIRRPKAEDTIVDYLIRRKEGDGLKVYDIVVEGVSMITTQRSEFSSVVSQKGLDYLIRKLAERSAQE